MVFDAPKPADWEVLSAREKAAKQADQNASHKAISVSVGRAIRASWQRTTQTVWTEKEPFSNAWPKPYQKLWKKLVGTQVYPAERSLSIGWQKVLEKPFKSAGKRGSYEDGKSLFERFGMERNSVALLPFFEGEVQLLVLNRFLLADDTVPATNRKRLSSFLSAHEKF